VASGGETLIRKTTDPGRVSAVLSRVVPRNIEASKGEDSAGAGQRCAVSGPKRGPRGGARPRGAGWLHNY